MFHIGDLVIYSAHGISQIDDIQERTYFDITKKYYTLHPLENPNLKISIPVDNEKVVILKLVNRDEAEEILETFKLPGIDWIEMDNQRNQIYSDLVKIGNRKDIASITNTLIRKKIEVENSGMKFHEKDRNLLTHIQDILFTELAHSLNTNFDEISKKITELISEN